MVTYHHAPMLHRSRATSAIVFVVCSVMLSFTLLSCASRGTPRPSTPGDGADRKPPPARDQDRDRDRDRDRNRDRDDDRAPRLAAVRRITIETERGRHSEIDLDTYVRGTVAAETWLRRDESEDVAERIFEVQALVARTYALANLRRHARDGFDLCSTTHCQIYRPAPEQGRWHDAIATAVSRTSGWMIAYDGAPILALFHANCGGGTSAAHDIWGGTARPYLVAVEDAACETDAAKWQASFTRDALIKVLDADARTRVAGRLDSIDVLETDRAGRVMLAALTGARSPVVRGEELRSLLQRTFGPRSIRGPRFTVHREGSSFVFDGSGIGHGAGLCQVGAMTRIRGGAAARDVIEHYYPGAKIVRIGREET